MNMTHERVQSYRANKISISMEGVKLKPKERKKKKKRVTTKDKELKENVAFFVTLIPINQTCCRYALNYSYM